MLSALKNFGITFLIAAILFGVIAYFTTAFVTDTMKDILDEEQEELNSIIGKEEDPTETGTENTNPSVTDPAERIPEGNSFNFLLVVSDYRPDLYGDYLPTVDQMYSYDWKKTKPINTTGTLSGTYRIAYPSTIVLVRVDKENRQYTYTYISSETRVFSASGYHTLAEIYNLYGLKTMSEYVHSITGVRIDYRVLLNGYNIDEFIKLCGMTTANLGRNIYRSSYYYTMQYETTVDRIGSDGNQFTEHIPNALTIGKGQIGIDETTLYQISAVRDSSAADIAAKEAYTSELVKYYLTCLGGMETEELRILIAQLITNESEWVNIDGLFPSEGEPTESETAETTETQAESETNAPEAEDSETEAETEEKSEKEVIAEYLATEIAEPVGPIIETNFTMNDFDSICELIEAVTYFDNITVSYPGVYKAADEENDAYFEADHDKALAVFEKYKNGEH